MARRRRLRGLRGGDRMRQAFNHHSPYSIDVPGGEYAAGRHIPASDRTRQKGRTMRISDFCFLVAGLAALCGMSLTW